MPGAAFSHWGPYGRAMRYFDPKGNTKHLAGAYTYNGYCLRLHASGDDTTLLKSGQAKDQNWLWRTSYKGFSQAPIISDGTWPSGWMKETDAVPGNLYDPANNNGATALSPNWNRIVIARHGMAINVAFMDGHATTVELPDLWKLKWHYGWDDKQYDYQAIRANIVGKYKRGT